MCFSATASFSAGIVLTVIGIVAIKKVQHRSQFMFAAIPLVFAVQQFSEGLLWLTLPYPELQFVQKNTAYFFLIIAQILWPIYVPVAILLVEKEKTRKKIQWVLIVFGLLASCRLAYCLLVYDANALIDCYHITYIQDYPQKLRWVTGILYVISTIAPPFFFHIKRMWMLGTTIMISYLITALFYENYLVSVWCFFASIISISVWFIMGEIKSHTHLEMIKKLHAATLLKIQKS